MDRQGLSLDFLSDEYLPGECSDNSIDEDELNSFLMGELAEPNKQKKKSYADKFTAKIMKRKNRKKNKETFFLAQSPKKKKKRKKTASQSSKLNPELEKLLQEATDLYLNKNFEEAVRILKELVRRAPGLHDPFHMLGLIYQNEFKDVTKATSYYLLAAHLVPTDTELWQRTGEMSQAIGNIDQAIYCFKKCQRDQEGGWNEQAVFALAICFLEKKDYHNAAKRFGVLFKLHPEDKLIANELARCFQLMGDLNSSLLVLTAYFNETLDGEILETILELNINLGLYEECFTVLENICSTNSIPPKKLPLNHMAYYVVASINLDKEVKEELDLLFKEYLEVKYIFLIANHMCQKDLEKAFLWFKRGFSLVEGTGEIHVPTTLKISKCLIMEQKHQEFLAKALKEAMETEPNNSEVVITLADVLLQLGRNDEADNLISRLTLNDLDKIKDIPEPIPEEERVQLLEWLRIKTIELEEEVLKDPKGRVYPCLLSYGGSKIYEKSKVNEWIDKFLKVVRDCELDTERAIQKLKIKLTRQNETNHMQENYIKEENSIFITSESKKHFTNKSYSFLKTKKELNLRSVEDIIGWDEYERLISTATVFMCMANRVKEAVEVLELIANNKKKYKSNQDIVEKTNLIKNIERNIFKSSSFGGLFKIAIMFARNEFLKDRFYGSLEGYARILGTGKMAHAALLPLSSSNEREALLENRAWVTRQLLHYPDNFQLLMLGGHFCTISGSWSYATQEYKRAFQKNHNDSLSSLCLATSYFNSLSRKTTGNLNKSLLMGMTFLQKYVDLRMRSVEMMKLSENCQMVFKAEGIYNVARSYHFMKLFDLAVPLYEKCLDIVSKVEEEKSEEEVECPCLVCDYCRRSGRRLPSSCKGFVMNEFITNHCKMQVQRCAAYNLFLIHCQHNNMIQANYISSKYIIWN